MNRKLKGLTEKATLPSNDPLLQVITKAKEEQKGRIENALIREIPLFPEPIVFFWHLNSNWKILNASAQIQRNFVFFV